MKITLHFLCLALSLAFFTNANADSQLTKKLDVLKKHYAKYIKSIDGNFIVFSNGKRLEIDDGVKKDHQNKLKQADIEDMLSQIYPVGKCNGSLRSKDMDPGRIRNDKFFRIIFGNSKKQVQENLIKIDWFGENLKFTKSNNAHIALLKVRDELNRSNNLRKYLTPSAGTFNWRYISGTKRLSMHSFAAAIDINLKYSHYWRWSAGKSGNVKSYKDKIPSKIVEIFEQYGFIWGGKWHHYDTMHFEYRPELIEIGKRFDTKC